MTTVSGQFVSSRSHRLELVCTPQPPNLICGISDVAVATQGQRKYFGDLLALSRLRCRAKQGNKRVAPRQMQGEYKLLSTIS